MKEFNELKAAVLGIVDEIQEKSVDGKLSLGDIVGLTDNLYNVYQEAQDWETIKAELQEYDQEQVEEWASELVDVIYKFAEIAKNLKK